jgi:hypothetical protein
MVPLIFVSVGAVLGISILAYLLIKGKNENGQLIKKYGGIIDVDAEIAKIRDEIKSTSQERDKAKAEFQDKKEKLTSEYDSAFQIYEKLKIEIALLEETLDMTEFGVYKPHFDFGASEQYRAQLENLNEQEKQIIKDNKAVICHIEWTINGSKTEGRKETRQIHKLMLRAFNGECDAALAKVRWDNILKMEERIKKAFETINKSGEVHRSYITSDYLDMKLKELRLTFEYQDKIHQEKEEQKHIQEEMREEERARKEIERAQEDAAKEEARYQKALEKAKEEADKASGDKLNKLNDKIQELEAQLKAAQEMKQRAISRAQITKSGHVYVISNMGSFGDNVFKIGMTRRLEPEDRVNELSGASVPFPFDVHAITYSDNAPELENKLHKHFETKRLNLVNNRKEFFSLNLEEIEEFARNERIEIKLTKLAEAKDFRQSQALRAKGAEAVKQVIAETVPPSIDSLFSKDEE